MSQIQYNISDQISNRLIDWWRIYGRNFPWRNSDDPYLILIAEVMLHRTRASQVEAIFNTFVDRYPHLESLSKAKSAKILDILRPLGLNRRSELIIELIEEINQVHGGKIPESRQDLLYLPGVGDYVASAVRCFAFDYPEIVLDTNTSRVISRLFGFEEKGEMRRKKEIRDAYQSILDKERPSEFNYALLDLGAAICTPRNKRCSICPVFDYCKTASDEVIRLEKSL
jgi:A/G-specific adenine glycosylase